MIEAIMALRKFINTQQLNVMSDACRGEEGEWFRAKILELAEQIKSMPKTYEQDGMGDEAVAHLHYFNAGMDWYVTERDAAAVQHQAYGLVKMFETEVGYISIVELIQNGVELDLHWQPKTLGEIKTVAA